MRVKWKMGFVALIAFVMIFNVAAYANMKVDGSGSSKLEAEVLRSSSVFIGKTKANIRMISYNKIAYASLEDLCSYFKLKAIRAEATKTINLVSNEKNTIKINKVPADFLKLSKIAVTEENSNIQYNGLDMLLESVRNNKVDFVQMEAFVSIFSKKILAKNNIFYIVDEEKPTTYLASVNGTKLDKTSYNYIYNLELLKHSLQPSSKPYTAKELETLSGTARNTAIYGYLIDTKVAQNKISLASSDFDAINNELRTLVKQMNGIKELRSKLQQNSISIYQYINNTKKNYMRNLLARALTKDIVVTEESAQTYYNENPTAFQVQEKRRVKHILVPTDQKALAEQLLTDLKNGADFDKLMLQYSIDKASSSSSEGMTFGKGEMVQPFEDAAYSLKVGELSPITESQYGYHIIKLEEIIPAQLLAFDTIKEQLKVELANSLKQEHWTQLINDWYTQSKITVY